jgi:hypothetical protein
MNNPGEHRRGTAIVAGISNEQQEASIGQRQKVVVITAGAGAYGVVCSEPPAGRLRDLPGQEVTL